MDRAVRCAETESEKRRVATWKKGVWDYMVEGRRQYLQGTSKKEQK